MMIVSVAYPQEYVLLGDNIVKCEAALLWLKNKASQELGITVKKIFLGGHSQGGYMVTRLNTMHQTNGVIANAPGPLNLVYRCQLEENGQIQPSAVCTKLKKVYGTTQKFRMVNTSKINENRPLIPVNYKDELEKHLITYTDDINDIYTYKIYADKFNEYMNLMDIIDVKYVEEYNEWIKVGNSINNLDMVFGEKVLLFDNVSRKSKNYNGKSFIAFN
jgi:hypothetical protein